MSHISKIELVIHSLEDLKEACRQLGFEFVDTEKVVVSAMNFRLSFFSAAGRYGKRQVELRIFKEMPGQC